MNTPLALHRKNHPRHQGGYTLIEIMLVLSIIAVLMAAGIYKLGDTLGYAKSVRVNGDLETISMQLRAYESENLFMPSTDQGLQALVTQPTTEPKPRRWRQWLKQEALIDPWGQPYQYKNPGKHNPTSFDLYSMGPDKTDNTDDDIGNWDSTSTTH